MPTKHKPGCGCTFCVDLRSKCAPPKMRQWQCTCGEWLDMGRAHHVHYENARQPTLEEMVKFRQAGHDADALLTVSDIVIVKWSDKFPRRDKPDE